jgi:hypothetical protein
MQEPNVKKSDIINSIRFNELDYCRSHLIDCEGFYFSPAVALKNYGVKITDTIVRVMRSPFP